MLYKKCTKFDAGGGGAFLNNNSGPMKLTACLISCMLSRLHFSKVVVSKPILYATDIYTDKHTESHMEVAPPPKNARIDAGGSA